MNRLKISIGILLLLVILSSVGLMTIHRECRRFIDCTEEIIRCVEAEDMDGAMESCEKLLASWEHFHDVTGLFLDGSRLEGIRERLGELPALIEAEHPEVLSHLDALRMLAEDLFRGEFPDLGHIL